MPLMKKVKTNYSVEYLCFTACLPKFPVPLLTGKGLMMRLKEIG